MCRLPRCRNIEAELLDMKDRVVRTRVQQRSSADWSDLQWPAPLASPAPELEGVADELRQLYEMYSDHDEVPERLAALARSAADAYEQLAGDPPTPTCAGDTDRTRDREGKSAAVRGRLGGRRSVKKKK